MRESCDGKESHWYIWSDRADAPPPGKGDSYFFVRPAFRGYDAARNEFWEYSERGRHYYWTKWRGVGAQGKLKENDLVRKAINSGDPRPLGPALRDYHDRVVAAGGTLYEPVTRLNDPAKRRFAMALVATLGDLVCFCNGKDVVSEPEDTWILHMKQQHAALQQLSLRRKLPTNADDKYYAYLRTAADGSERVLVLLNFQSSPQSVEIDLSGLATSGLVELKTGNTLNRENPLKVELPAYGFGLYEVKEGRVN